MTHPPARCHWRGPFALALVVDGQRRATVNRGSGWLLETDQAGTTARVVFDGLPWVFRLPVDVARAGLRVDPVSSPELGPEPSELGPAIEVVATEPGRDVTEVLGDGTPGPALPDPAALVELLLAEEHAEHRGAVLEQLVEPAEPEPFDPAALDARQVLAVVKAHPAEAAEAAATMTSSGMAKRYLLKAAKKYRETGSFG